MRRARALLLGVVAAAVATPASADAVAARAPKVPRSAELYSRHCQGCHGHTGVSVPEVPALAGRVGHFAATPRGRDYMIRLPNVAFAHLGDADLARMMNWMLATYSGRELPDGFRPFTEAEVARLRAQPLKDTMAERRAVVDGLVAAGQIPSRDALAFTPRPTP